MLGCFWTVLVIGGVAWSIARRQPRYLLMSAAGIAGFVVEAVVLVALLGSGA